MQSEEDFCMFSHQAPNLHTLLSLLVQDLCSHLRGLLHFQWITSTLHSRKSVLKLFLPQYHQFLVSSTYKHAIIPAFKKMALFNFSLKWLSPSHFSALLKAKLFNKAFCTHCPIPEFPFSLESIYSHYSTEIALPFISTLSYLVVTFSGPI